MNAENVRGFLVVTVRLVPRTQDGIALGICVLELTVKPFLDEGATLTTEGGDLALRARALAACDPVEATASTARDVTALLAAAILVVAVVLLVASGTPVGVRAGRLRRRGAAPRRSGPFGIVGPRTPS